MSTLAMPICETRKSRDFAFCKMSLKMLYHSISDEENPTSIVKKLFDAIEECKSPIKSINRITDLDNQLC